MSTVWDELGADALTRSLRRSRLFANLAMIALGLCAVLSVAGFVSDRSYHNLIQRTLDGTTIPTLDQAAAADDRVHALALLDLGLFVLTGIVFIVWFRDAYKNVGRLGVAGLRWSSGWAVGAWLVPFLNLRRPKEMLNDMWRGSNPSMPRGSTVGTGVDRPPRLYQFWWGFWIVGWVLARFAYLKLRNASTLSGLGTATHLLMAADVVDLVGAVLAIAVVYSLSSRQHKRAAALGGPPSAASF